MSVSGAYLLNMLTGTLFSLANIYWVGSLGATAQAAVTLAAIPIMLVLTLLPIVSVGAGILIAHAVGARDQRRANRIFNEAFGASWLVTAVIGALAWSCREAFATLLTPDAETAAQIATYYRWFIPSVTVQIPMLVMAGALGATGNIRIATAAQSGTVVLNVLLAPVLMFGLLGLPPLGLEGTGLASFVACAAALAGLVLHSFRERAYLTLDPDVWFARPRELWNALKIGLPTGMESGVVAGYMMVVALLMRPFGPVELAGFGVGQRVLQAGILPLMALSSATSLVVGQNFGAGRIDRVRATLRASLLFGLVAPLLWVVFESMPGWISSRFSDDPAVIDASVRFLRIEAFSLVPAAVGYSAVAVLAGMGNTKAGLFTSLVYGALVVVPSWALAQMPGFQPTWLWVVMVVANLLQAMVALYLLRRAFNKHRERFGALTVAQAGSA